MKFIVKTIGGNLALVSVLAIFAAFSESLGIYFFISLFVNGTGVEGTNSNFSQIYGIYDLIGLENPNETLLYTSVACLFSLKAILIYIYRYQAQKTRADLQQKLKKSFLVAYFNADFYEINSKTAGFYIDILNFQVSQILGAYHSIVNLIVSVSSALIYLAVIVYIGPTVGFVLLGTSVIVIFSFRALNRYVHANSIITSQKSAKLTDFVSQALHSAKYLIISDKQEDYLNKKLFPEIDTIRSLDLLRGRASAFTLAIREFAIFSIVLISFWFAIQIFYVNIGDFLIISILAFRAASFFLSIQTFYQAIKETIGGVEKYEESYKHLLNVKQENYEGKPYFSSNFEFKNVGFYDKNLKSSRIKNANFKIEKNKITAIIGPSGAGKSTVLDLMTKILVPSSGTIISGGHSLQDYSRKSLRNIIGYLPQEPIIFHDTIKNNISCWDKADDFDLLVKVASEAGIYDFIKSKKNTWEHMLLDHGQNISGGQKQRIALARELYKKPKLLILDEPTSALDVSTEAKIINTLQKLKTNTTIVIIAHRPETIQAADLVIDMAKI